MNVSFNIDTGCRGSFRKIVKRGQKLMVEKFEGGITILVPTPHIVFVNFKGVVLVKGEAKAEVLNVCE